MELPPDVETPALVVDLDRLEANLRRTAAAVAGRGLSLRPHAKTHKSTHIGRMQLDAGAVGLTVATLSEAEVFAAAGCTDLLVAYPVVPRGTKADRLRRLLDEADVVLGVDSEYGAAALADADRGRTVRVALEVDSGQHRTGVDPEAVVPLAARCRSLGLEVAGIFTHGGHAYAGPDATSRAAADEGTALTVSHDLLRAAGFELRFVSAGSTPTTGASRPEAVTEERPGTYVFHDRQQLALGACTPDDLALTVAATVVSVGHGRFVVDAGSKALASDRPPWLVGHGWVPELGEAVVTTLSEHHGIVEGARVLPSVGDVVAVVANHACTVVNLFDEYVVMRDGEVVDRWPVSARGRNT